MTRRSVALSKRVVDAVKESDNTNKLGFDKVENCNLEEIRFA